MSNELKQTVKTVRTVTTNDYTPGGWLIRSEVTTDEWVRDVPVEAANRGDITLPKEAK